MNYNWNWGVLWQSTGVGSELYWHWLLKGFGWLLVVGGSAWVIALVVGFVLGVMRTLPSKLAQNIAATYVNIFRNAPLLIQLFIWFYVVPTLLPDGVRAWWFSLSFNTTAVMSASIGLGLFTAARITEQVRTGIESLPKGQANAGFALGFTTAQTYRYVLLPQAFRVILPPMSSELTNCFKNASVASLVGVAELISQTKTISEYTQNNFEVYTFTTVLYLVFNLALILGMTALEKKLRIKGQISGQGGAT
ncbi:amino acid ABC transporter permease [Moraxella caviae]|uniref:Amino acid ABC transporter permease n=1 Tax=Moraxella caviae TaxID=34060 RepID=A0A1T0A1P5_9GAMM|nr:amino acid ABC transporter permease [Moraxella caviae]OOR89607.1 amino acid ABC transporter permease [Moraxella caviae]STZ10292.1 Inner membrane amino-acid ABC transporter permease protein yecS [Moraxella caviae]